jgi:hypothetical protein
VGQARPARAGEGAKCRRTGGGGAALRASINWRAKHKAWD